MSTKFIKLVGIDVQDTSIKFNFIYSKELSQFFNAISLRVIYDLSLYRFSLKDVPRSVLTTVFLGNMLPIAWLEDAELIVESVDKTFYESIEKIKKGYEEMYPNLRFLGKVTCNKIEKNCPRPLKRNMCFFSLGVDAWQTLISNRNNNIMLFTMIGADFYLDKEKNHAAIEKHIQKVSNDFNTENIIFYTNLRKVIKEENLNKKYQTALGFHWWHRIEHGMPVITHSFPIAYLLGSKYIYFASSYSFKDAVIHKCATAPSIDNYLTAVDFNVVHDGYQFTRQDKIFNICNFSNENNVEIFIHVCWGQFSDIHNCSKCEKCLRTIFGILAEGYDPNDFGLTYNDDTNTMIKKLITNDKLPLTEEMWEQIILRFKMNIGIIKNRKELSWIKDFNFEQRMLFSTQFKKKPLNHLVKISSLFKH